VKIDICYSQKCKIALLFSPESGRARLKCLYHRVVVRKIVGFGVSRRQQTALFWSCRAGGFGFQLHWQSKPGWLFVT